MIAPFFFAVAVASGDGEATSLEAKLAHDAQELSTSDCAAACKALASIRRAADRICELAPGPRCDAAKTKADDATRRVREACPECAVAVVPTPEAPPPAMAAPPPPQPAEAYSKSESRGGCRSCATTGSHAPDTGDLMVFAVAALLLTRRSRKNRRRL